jgi:hypothetical protein
MKRSELLSSDKPRGFSGSIFAEADRASGLTSDVFGLPV